MAPLAPDTPPELALRQIATACRDDLLKHRAVVLKSRRPIGIHQTRVALRRLRAAFTLFRAAAESDLARREMEALGAEAKWLAGECAPARDLHVFLTETVEAVPPEAKRVTQRLARSHLERARAALSGDRFSTFEVALAGFIDHVPATPAGRLDVFGKSVLDARHGKVLKRAHRLGSLDGRRLHRLRIAIKKLRYAAEFLLPVYAAPPFASRAAKPYIEATVRLQGALGALNDHAVADRMLVDIAAASRLDEHIERALASLAKQAAAGDKRRRHKLQRAWKKFEKAGRFWRATTKHGVGKT